MVSLNGSERGLTLCEAFFTSKVRKARGRGSSWAQVDMDDCGTTREVDSDSCAFNRRRLASRMACNYQRQLE